MRRIAFLAVAFGCLRAAMGGGDRIPVYLQAIIVNPGHYLVTRDFHVASGSKIQIQASDVRIDLNGFTVSSDSASLAGDIIVRNAIARGFAKHAITLEPDGSPVEGDVLTGGNNVGAIEVLGSDNSVVSKGGAVVRAENHRIGAADRQGAS